MKKIHSFIALISYWIFKILVLPIYLFPVIWRWRLGQVLGFLWWDVFRIRRYTVFRNIKIVFPKMNKVETRQFARLALSHFGFQFIEFLRLPWLGERDLKNVFFEGLNHLQPRNGKAPYILSCHMGPGDLVMNLLCMKGVRLSLISKEFRLTWVNQFWFFVRNQKGLRFIPPHGKDSAFKILKEPLAGYSVIFVLDQYMGPPYGIPSKFFGRETGTAHGLALFVKKTKIPVVPMYTYYDKNLKLHVVAESPLDWESHLAGEDRDDSSEEFAKSFVELCNSKLEQIILKHPEQWMWVHRRWKEWG